jgi:16S rRNA (guanine527-N7)-methyltransferase
VKHSTPGVEAGPDPLPAAAQHIFGARLPLAERYARWLVSAGVERGLLGPREADRVWDRHLLNCAALARWLPEQGRVVDLGSGAGLPGVVVAILRPDLDVVLLEPLLRRSTFLREVVDDLELANTTVVRERAEDYAEQQPAAADAVVARAVAPLDRLLGWSAPLICRRGFLLALKGESVSQELSAAAQVGHRWGMSPPVIEAASVGLVPADGVSSSTSGTRVVRIQRVDLRGPKEETATVTRRNKRSPR